MNINLAEKLLRKVMGWTAEEYSKYGLQIQAIGVYKYDRYQQFSPGMRFTESLARWLEQFPPEKRIDAFHYVTDKLVFVSETEMKHLVSLCYPDIVRPRLMKKASELGGFGRHRVRQISESHAFQRLQRETLFLGLSDGARTDVLRRSNPTLSNEQVRNTHELSAERISSLLSDLKSDTAQIEDSKGSSGVFRTLVLLDDFAGSGLSYVRQTSDGTITGKIGKFIKSLREPTNRHSDLVKGKFHLIVVLYMATEIAIGRVKNALDLLATRFDFEVDVFAVQQLPGTAQMDASTAGEMASLIEDLYDTDNETEATKVGGTDLRYGFNHCGLNLVLEHNTPNNSIGLLWANGSRMTPLFPRITRHKDFA